MPSKQSKTYLDIQDLTEGDIKVMKELATWPFHLQRSNTFNLSVKIGISESYVGKIFRKLSGRGIIQKSVSGSYFLNKEIQRRMRKEYEEHDMRKDRQDLLDEKDKPLTPEEADKLLQEQYTASQDIEEGIEELDEAKKKDKETQTQHVG